MVPPKLPIEFRDTILNNAMSTDAKLFRAIAIAALLSCVTLLTANFALSGEKNAQIDFIQAMLILASLGLAVASFIGALTMLLMRRHLRENSALLAVAFLASVTTPLLYIFVVATPS